MPDTFRLICPVSCPNCGTVLLNSTRFQWGEVPGQTYKPGEAIQWVRDECGEISIPFVLRGTGRNRWRWNCGDPETVAAIVLDEDIYTRNHALSCENCGQELAAVSCRILSNVIDKVEALTKEKLDDLFQGSVGKAHIATLDTSGNVTPREDWFDHPVRVVK